MEETQKSELKKKIQKDNSTEKIYPEEKENQESEKIEKDDSLANNDIPEKKDVEMIEKPKAQKPGSELFERIEMPDIKKLEIKPENEVLEETKAESKEEIQSFDPNSLEDCLKKIQMLVYDCLYDEALILTKRVQSFENFNFKALPLQDQNILVDVEETMKNIEEIYFYLNEEIGWEVDSSNAEVTTKYKKYPNNNGYLMKLEGELNFPVENMCSIVYEIDNFNEFVPFCSKSYPIKKLSKGSKLCYFELDIPFWSKREGYIRGLGIDRIDVNNTLLIISKTIDEDKALLQRIEFDIPSNEKAVRLKMDHFCFEITPINRNKFKLRSLMNIEPKVAYIPHFVINFFARKIGAHMFTKLLKLAENMDVKRWEEIKKKEENKEYYKWINIRIDECERKLGKMKEMDNSKLVHI